MADPVTSNLSLIEMATGTASGTWGTVLNASMIAIVDQALGNTVSVALSSSNVNLTTTQRQNLGFALTGTLTGDISVTLPLNPNSSSAAVGGEFIFDNNTTGAFNVTVKTIATASIGVIVPQGVRSFLYSDTTNIKFADDAQNLTQVYNGNPNANVAGFAGSASQRASKVIDRSTNEEYLCTTGTGSAAGAIWYKNLPYSFPGEGYLTASNDATNPILTGDSIGAATIYYTAFRGNQLWVWNGISFVPITIPGGQVAITLSGSAQAANGIYDVLGFLNGTAVVFAFSPAWSVATVGAGARGTGAGTPQLSRVNGILVNAVQQTANNGATTYAIGTSKGTYLGSVWIDSAAGQVTCHRSYGQSRKFGVWDAYNRLPIILKAGDSTASWTAGANWRASNNNANNNASVFCGLPEELANINFQQNIDASTAAGALIGIGANSTTAPSGFAGQVPDAAALAIVAQAGYAVTAPFIGANTYTCLEKNPGGGGLGYGTELNMVMTAQYNG